MRSRGKSVVSLVTVATSKTACSMPAKHRQSVFAVDGRTIYSCIAFVTCSMKALTLAECLRSGGQTRCIGD